MDTITIFSNQFATLRYYRDVKIVHHTLHKTVQGEAFRHVLNEGLEVFKKYEAHKWLSDDRQNATLPEDDAVWAKTVWFPKVLEVGWQYWALVWPPKVLVRMNLQEYINAYRPQGLRVMVFNDTKQALPWLVRAKITPKIKPLIPA